jgi:hypothetical protein
MSDMFSSPVRCALCIAASLALSCAETMPPIDRNDPNQFDVIEVDQIRVEEPIAFTAINYNFTGPNSIAELNALIDRRPPNEFNYYAYAPGVPFPFEGNCTPFNERFPVRLVTEQDLPMTIEGIVTIYPRYFRNQLFCGQRERFYGSYFIQDSTGGVVVLRDSRVAPFTFGARVRLKVSGVQGGAFNNVPSRFVLMSEVEEVVSAGNPIYYEPTEQAFGVPDIGKVKRVRGVIVQAPTNFNFNEMRLRHPTEPGIFWDVSLDRELGQRSPPLELGDTIETTGPVLDAFGLRMIIFSLGQIDNISLREREASR